MVADPTNNPHRPTTQQVADMAGVSTAYVRQLADTGRFDAAKDNRGRWTFDHAQVEAWLRNRVTRQPAAPATNPPTDMPTDESGGWYTELLQSELADAKIDLLEQRVRHLEERLAQSTDENLRLRDTVRSLLGPAADRPPTEA